MSVAQCVIGKLDISAAKCSEQRFLSSWVLRNYFPAKGESHRGWGVWLGHRLNAVRCCRILNSRMMSRDFSLESSILGRYPGWYGEWAEIVDYRTGPQNTQVWPLHQCQSSSSLFLAYEEISVGIESSDLECCLSPWLFEFCSIGCHG